VFSNWRITVWIIAEELSIALEGAHAIPKNDLKMRKFDARIANEMPRFGSEYLRTF
jgi:hypothetical protein